MRKHARHARPPRLRKRISVVAAAGGAVALLATFPGTPAHASTIPGTPDRAPGTTEPGAAHLAASPRADIGLATPAVRFAVNPSRYTIKAGDTLGAIAGKFCGNPAKYPNLAGANHISDPDLIITGRTIDASERACAHAALVVRQPAARTAVVTAYQPRHSRSVSSVSRPSYVAAGTYSFAGLERLWVSAGGPAWAESAAAAVAECESGGRANAYNPSGATGIWQILGAVVRGNLYDPYVNALNAVSKFKASGDTWAQWVCQP